MIKELKKYQIKLTPFTTAKNWFLDNTVNEDLILTEAGDTLALQFIDYGSGDILDDPIRNDSCSLALEQQDADEVRYREGLKTTGIFYPEKEAVNEDGTYKRLVYAQIKTTFYNEYRDPTKMWGLNYIDFEIGKTEKHLADQVRLFDIPQTIFGEKIIETSVELFDNTIDDFYTIKDDGYGNLYASKSLFSRFQEVANFLNVLVSGSDYYCGDYLTPKPIETTYGGDTISDINVGLLSGIVSAYVLIDTASFNIGIVSGTTGSYIPSDSSSLDIGILCGSIQDTIVTVSGSDSASFNVAWSAGSFGSETFDDALSSPGFSVGWDGGSLNVVITSASVGPETASVDMSFFGGSIINTIVPITMSAESGSVGLVFYSGSCKTVIVPVSMSAQSHSVVLGFYSGSVYTRVTVDSENAATALNVGLLSGIKA